MEPRANFTAVDAVDSALTIPQNREHNSLNSREHENYHGYYL
jgi:hypothetical protein